jgi:Tol biopolymer transport system component
MIDKALNVIAVDAAGIASSAPTQVTVAAEGGWAPDGVVYPSPDGSCLAIVGEWAVTYVIEVSTGKAEHLLGGKTIEAFWSWYPDSRHVLVSPRMGGLLLYNIYNFDEKVPLAILAYGAIGGAAVSPDGQKVIYYSSDDVSSPAGVWMVNADGREARLLFESGDMWSSAWSPDGKQIALQGGRMVMDADGSNLRELGSFRFCGSPRWSPDSRTLALVVSTWDGTSSCYDWNDDVLKAADILLVDVESGKNRPLLADGSAGNIDPAWSPDGQQIVFVSNRSGATEVWAVDADGTNLRQLTSDGQYKRYPFWRRP